MKERLYDVCKSLKSPYAEVAVDYFYQELSVVEIAQKLQRNEKTVQTQIYRSKAMLKKLYERSEGSG